MENEECKELKEKYSECFNKWYSKLSWTNLEILDCGLEFQVNIDD
jgi:hypothetical protein